MDLESVTVSLFSNPVVSYERAAVMHATLTEVDFIEEIRLRRWAREHYVPADERDESWHPVVLEEMQAKDADMGLPDDELVVNHDLS
jgi:hypothetical protein